MALAVDALDTFSKFLRDRKYELFSAAILGNAEGTIRVNGRVVFLGSSYVIHFNSEEEAISFSEYINEMLTRFVRDSVERLELFDMR